MFHLFVVIFFSLIIKTIDAVCPLTLHSKCLCDPINLITNCSNGNISDLSILHDIPIQTKILIFRGNNLNRLPIDAFGLDRKQPKPLLEMDLSANNISFIDEKTFRGFESLKKLILNNNQIVITDDDYPRRLFENLKNLEELHLKNAFANTEHPKFTRNLMQILEIGNLSKLKILNIEQNMINNFPHEDIFCSMISLQKLFLSYNTLHNIRFNLTCTPRLRLLDLSYNRYTNLDNISISMIDYLPRSFHVNMTGNPFRCDCSMDFFLEWLHKTPLFVMNKDNYVCHDGYPMTNVHRHLMELQVNNLQCDPTLNMSSTMMAYIRAIITIISICIVFFVIIIVCNLRRSACELCRQICTNITAKRYSALAKEEKSDITANEATTRVVEISV